MIYLDTSALVKLVFEEDESAALGEWLSSRVDVPKISSDLSIIELMRVCRRADPSVAPDARRLLDGIDLLPIDRAVVERAAEVTPTQLRSLDAVHLASVLLLQTDLTALVSYDVRLCTAAVGAGLEVASPA